jgi:hypothetical protein
MTRNELGLILFAFLYCGLTIAPKSAVAAQQPDHQNTATPEKTARAQNQASESSNDGKDKPLITIPGLCDNPPADKDAASNCKTVITRAQFEKVLDAVEPGMALKARREFAQLYVEALVMSKKAEQMGLDKGPSYAEQMKLARIQILSRQLKKMLEEKSTHISDEDIEEYYRSNIARFEKAEMDRIYVPKAKQPQSASDKPLSNADPQKRSSESEQTMKEEADSLRARAVDGEDFAKLQADAYNFAGIKSVAPNTSIKVRRISLPPTQVAAMDLKPGEVSPVFADPNGFVIYRVKTKDTIPLEQARGEIKETLRSQRMRDEMDDILEPTTPTFDESYFAPARPPQGKTGAAEPTNPTSQPHSTRPNW